MSRESKKDKPAVFPVLSRKEGFLNKEGEKFSKAFRKRYFVLDGNVLCYYTSAKLNKDNLRGVIYLQDYTVRAPNTSKRGGAHYDLTLASRSKGGRVFHLSSESQVVRDEWAAALENNMSFEDQLHRARQSSERKIVELEGKYETEAQKLATEQARHKIELLEKVSNKDEAERMMKIIASLRAELTEKDKELAQRDAEFQAALATNEELVKKANNVVAQIKEKWKTKYARVKEEKAFYMAETAKALRAVEALEARISDDAKSANGGDGSGAGAAGAGAGDSGGGSDNSGENASTTAGEGGGAS